MITEADLRDFLHLSPHSSQFSKVGKKNQAHAVNGVYTSSQLNRNDPRRRNNLYRTNCLPSFFYGSSAPISLKETQVEKLKDSRKKNPSLMFILRISTKCVGVWLNKRCSNTCWAWNGRIGVLRNILRSTWYTLTCFRWINTECHEALILSAGIPLTQSFLKFDMNERCSFKDER